MASSQAMYLKAGDLARAFQFGNPVVNSTTIVANSQPVYKESVYSAFQATVAGSGAVGATVAFQVSLDDNTGRGFIFGNANAPGCAATTTSASATITANQGGVFTSAMVGALVFHPNVPIGTTVTAVNAAGTTLTMSANATASGSGQLGLFAQNWCSTVLGTITLIGTNFASDGFTTGAPWRYVRAQVTAISGTGAAVTCLLGN